MSTLPTMDETTLPAFVTAIRRAVTYDDAIRRARTFLGLDNEAGSLPIECLTGNPCNVGKRIDALRAEMGFSLAEISERCEVIGETVRGFTHGRRFPKLPTLIALAACFDVSLDYMACLTDDRYVQRRCRDTFSNRLSHLMDREGFTLVSIGARTKISFNTICWYKTERCSPGYWNFIELAKVLDVSLDYLAGVTNVEKPFQQKS